MNILLVNRATAPRTVRLNSLPGDDGGAAPVEVRAFTRGGVSAIEAALQPASTLTLPPESIVLSRFPSGQ